MLKISRTDDKMLAKISAGVLLSIAWLPESVADFAGECAEGSRGPVVEWVVICWWLMVFYRHENMVVQSIFSFIRSINHFNFFLNLNPDDNDGDGLPGLHLFDSAGMNAPCGRIFVEYDVLHQFEILWDHSLSLAIKALDDTGFLLI